MKTIWKFPLAVTGAQVISIPLPAQVLTVQPQGNGVYLWAEVDPEGQRSDVEIVIAGTGHELPERRMRYINTFQLNDGTLVFHAFEVTR